MGGGLMQLVAYGAQDIYLTGNPQITFFKVVYRRHTNFAVESIEQTFNGAATLGNKFSCTISRNGDLLSRVYLEVDLLAATGAANGVDAVSGFNLIDNVEVEIGGQCIDKHYGEWMTLWTDLTHGSDKKAMLGAMMPANTTAVKNYLPLQFWFCRNPGLALPLIALQYHEVKLNVQFVAPTGQKVNNVNRCCVFCDYIFLDTDERRRFAQVSHEYLIEQLQFSNPLTGPTLTLPATTPVAGAVTAVGQAELRFNHPVKELVWVIEQTTGANAGGRTAATQEHTLDNALLQLNGHDRFKRRDGSYFTNVQRYQHHVGSAGSLNAHIYSFGLKPEEHQPSGTCNFSRIDNAVLSYTVSNRVPGNANAATDTNVLKVYAVNYNVLRIMSGMGGLAYSN